MGKNRRRETEAERGKVGERRQEQRKEEERREGGERRGKRGKGKMNKLNIAKKQKF